MVLYSSHLHQEVQCVLFNLLTWKGAHGSLSASIHEVYGVLLTHDHENEIWHPFKIALFIFLDVGFLGFQCFLNGSSIFKLHVTSSVSPDMFNKRNTWKKLFLVALSSWREVYLWGQKWLIAPNNWWKLKAWKRAITSRPCKIHPGPAVYLEE